MFQLSSKSLVAKLLSQEDIDVEFRKTSTAYADLKGRTLVLPILKDDLSEDIGDLFISHEVGHFLFTDLDEWSTGIELTKKSILNVVEDNRIERMIQKKYPGIKACMVKGYNELHYTRNFFGVVNDDLNKLSLIDRINMHSKIGAQLCIQFTDTELELLKKVNETESFDDVVQVSIEIEKFIKESKKSEEQSYCDNDNDGDYEDDDSMDFEFAVDSDIDGDDSDDDEEDYGKTQKIFDDNVGSLLSDDSKEKHYIDIPDVNSDEYIVSYKELYSKICEQLHTQYHIDYQQYPDYSEYLTFIKKNGTIVQYLVNEFNLKQNAIRYKNIKEAKSGNINVNKLYAHQISNDIFKTMQIVKDGKSHGVVMFVDWSGSMKDYIGDTLKQVIVTSMFCRKLNIPFEIYAFSSNFISEELIKTEELGTQNTLVIDKSKCILMNILSSKMRHQEFKSMVNLLLNYDRSGFNLGIISKLSDEYNVGRPHYRIKCFNMYNTPLNETIILAMDLLPKFKSKYNLQIVNTIFLTDGESDQIEYTNFTNEYPNTTKLGYHVTSPRDNTLIIKNKKTKVDKICIPNFLVYMHRYRIDIGITRALYEILHDSIDDTDNIIGFRIVIPQDFKTGRIDYLFGSNLNCDTANKELRKMKKQKYLSFTNNSFDKFFLFLSDSLNFEVDEFIIDSDNMSNKRIANTFLKHSKERIQNRMFLKEFINIIA